MMNNTLMKMISQVHFYGYVFQGVCLSTGGLRASVDGGIDPPSIPPEYTPGAYTLPPDTANAADSTHPSGLHSCCA